MQRHPTRIAAVGLLVGVLALAAAPAAEAGCLSEYRTCGECAHKRFKGAVWNLDLDEMNRAFEDALDCDIDLVHCLTFGHHHQYSCA